jgi:hypothetical protein
VKRIDESAGLVTLGLGHDERHVSNRHVFLATHKLRQYLQRRGVPGEGAVWNAGDEDESDEEESADTCQLRRQLYASKPELALQLESLRQPMERFKWKSLAQSAKFCTWDGMCPDVLELFFSGLMSARAIRVLCSSPVAEITHESFGLKDWEAYLKDTFDFDNIGMLSFFVCSPSFILIFYVHFLWFMNYFNFFLSSFPFVT